MGVEPSSCHGLENDDTVSHALQLNSGLREAEAMVGMSLKPGPLVILSEQCCTSRKSDAVSSTGPLLCRALLVTQVWLPEFLALALPDGDPMGVHMQDQDEDMQDAQAAGLPNLEQQQQQQQLLAHDQARWQLTVYDADGAVGHAPQSPDFKVSWCRSGRKDGTCHLVSVSRARPRAVLGWSAEAARAKHG